MLTEHLAACDLGRAAQLLRMGQLVAFPTETVYGLGASLVCPQAIAEVFAVKGRPADNPLIVHVSTLAQIEAMVKTPPFSFYSLVEAFFPGPLTVVLHHNGALSPLVSAGLSSVAVRMPAHPIAHQLISLLGVPVVAPSANLSGKPSATEANHVLEDFEGKIAGVVEGGQCQIGLESTVVSVLEENVVLLRPGAITQEQIESVLGMPIIRAKHKKDQRTISPGMKYRHYAPHAPIRLFPSQEALLEACANIAFPFHLMVLACSTFPLPFGDLFLLHPSTLYAHLRHADRAQYAAIWIVCDAQLLQKEALLNRILHASSQDCD